MFTRLIKESKRSDLFILSLNKNIMSLTINEKIKITEK